MKTADFVRISKEQRYVEIKSEADKQRQSFIASYGLDKIKGLSGKVLLEKMFQHDGPNGTTSMSNELTSGSTSHYAGRAGDMSQFVLYYNLKEQCWKYGKSKASKPISESDAISKAELIRDQMIRIGQYIESVKADPDSVDYSHVSTLFDNTEFGKIQTYLKYFEVLYPNVIPPFLNKDWQRIAFTEAEDVSEQYDDRCFPIENFKPLAKYIKSIKVDPTVFGYIISDAQPTFENYCREQGLKSHKQYKKGISEIEKKFNINIDEQLEQDPDFNDLKSKIDAFEEFKDHKKDNLKSYAEKYIEYKKSLGFKPSLPVFHKSSIGIYEVIDNALDRNKQIILTGAPGTGKTYSVLNYVKHDVSSKDHYKFVQFHPSYDYTDFVEGLRPIDTAGSISFVRLDGIFKNFCRTIVEDNLCYAYPSLKKASDRDKQEKLEEIFNILNDLSANENLDDDSLKEELRNFIDGSEPYYFIIDEINRADLSKVFGEMMFALEESYRGIENRFPTQYSNLPIYKITESAGIISAESLKFDCFKKGFFIPHNLYIIGTMNDIDKSVEAFDFALRRRFEWIEIKTNEVLLDGLSGAIKDKTLKSNPMKLNELAERIKKMNEVISDTNGGGKFGLSEAYHIGHAYFKNVSLDATGNFDGSLKDVFENNITSIIKEYLRGRRESDINSLIDECRKALSF